MNWYQEAIDHNDAYRPTLSLKAKQILTNALFETEIENRKIDAKKDRLMHTQQKLIESVINAQKCNIEELDVENKMLRETVEKYRKLYFDLCNFTRNTNSDPDTNPDTDYTVDAKSDLQFDGEGPDIKSFVIESGVNSHGSITYNECVEV
jgi:hypothetical protein